MSGPDDIDALRVARRVLAEPRVFRISTHETLAMAGCLLGLDQVVDTLEAELRARDPLLAPTTNARLAAAIAAAVMAFDAAQASQGQFEAAFRTVKTIFEEEFPHVAA